MTTDTPAPAQAAPLIERKLWRDLVTPGALLAVLVAMTAFLAAHQLVTVRETRQWVRHSHEVIETTQTLFSHVQDVESGQRGYMIFGDPKFLDAYESGRTEAPKDMQRLAWLVRDNPAQTARVARLTALAKQRIAISEIRVNLIRQGRIQEAHTYQFLGGKTAMDGLRRTVAELMQAEGLLLAQRTAASDAAQFTTFAGVSIVSLVALVGLGWLILAMATSNRRLAHEITERAAAEAAQRESEALYRAIFANSADYLYVIDVSPEQTFSIAELNPAFERATGITMATTGGRDLATIATGPWSRAVVEHYQAVVRAGKPVFNRSQAPLATGTRVWESVLTPVRNLEGRVDRIVGATRDVTERDEAERQLRRAQRMEAIGHLTGGVAHDFNNLLQVIRGNLELVANAVASNKDASQRVTNALRGADRAAQLTRQLLAFARRQPLEPKVVNLGRLVSDMAEMLRSSLGESVQIETVVAGGLWNTLADPAQVENAILNLAINARDAMPGGGRLTIEITNAVLDAAYGREAEIAPGQYVLLAISDTGHGMDEATRLRVFEPFFTTKGTDKGTGLGLSMVYGFVKQSNGHVQVYSEIDQGTTIKIYLPRSRQSETVTTAPEPGSLRGHSEVILVVEDDDLVRASAVGMLRDLGYTCVHASDGAAGLAVLQSDAKVDLLFTDVIMPGPVKSRELAAEAQRLRPGLPVLYTSGYTENAIVHHGRLDEGVQLLSKPYAQDDLARKIRAMLKDGRRAVLLVEDDVLVRMAAQDMIESLGFSVLQAGDAKAALELLKSGERIDILFTDVGLPGMRGPALAKEAARLRPALKIIFASGYGETEETAAITGAVQLAKPYDRDLLAEALGAVV
jgi:PAS domain S-box-containing protein